VLVYPAGMSVSTQTLTLVTQELRKHRATLRTRWRVLSSHQQALMLLAHLRKGARPTKTSRSVSALEPLRPTGICARG
jgi:hypothetical protein